MRARTDRRVYELQKQVLALALQVKALTNIVLNEKGYDAYCSDEVKAEIDSICATPIDRDDDD